MSKPVWQYLKCRQKYYFWSILQLHGTEVRKSCSRYSWTIKIEYFINAVIILMFFASVTKLLISQEMGIAYMGINDTRNSACI